MVLSLFRSWIRRSCWLATRVINRAPFLSRETTLFSRCSASVHCSLALGAGSLAIEPNSSDVTSQKLHTDEWSFSVVLGNIYGVSRFALRLLLGGLSGAS